MACASSLQFSLTLQSSSSSLSSHSERLFVIQSIPTTLLLRHRPYPRSVLALSRRRRNNNSAITSSPSKKNKKKNKQSLGRSNVGDEDDIDDDAFEALFRQLEEDLKNDESFVNEGDEEVSEEDLVKLERELEEAVGDDELLRVLDSTVDDETDKEDEVDDDGYEDEDEDDNDEDDDEDEDERPVLKNWQLRRLAYALKKGRRKTNIKSLAAEIGVDRAIVLEYLREPPPNLLMLSAALPDEPVPEISEPETKQLETVPLVTTATDEAKPEAEVEVPVHVMQNNWSAQKRLKKVQVETLERVYRRTKRPTNSMVSSIVHVTNLPRKRVVKWFEDKRAEDGVPDHRGPYQRPAVSETVFNS